MSGRCYVRRGGKARGPLEFAQVRSLIEGGGMGEDDRVGPGPEGPWLKPATFLKRLDEREAAAAEEPVAEDPEDDTEYAVTEAVSDGEFDALDEFDELAALDASSPTLEARPPKVGGSRRMKSRSGRDTASPRTRPGGRSPKTALARGTAKAAEVWEGVPMIAKAAVGIGAVAAVLVLWPLLSLKQQMYLEEGGRFGSDSQDAAGLAQCRKSLDKAGAAMHTARRELRRELVKADLTVDEAYSEGVITRTHTKKFREAFDTIAEVMELRKEMVCEGLPSAYTRTVDLNGLRDVLVGLNDVFEKKIEAGEELTDREVEDLVAGGAA